MSALVHDADGARRLTLALLLALGLHAAFIFGVAVDGGGDVVLPHQPLRFEMVPPPSAEQSKAPESRAVPDPPKAGIEADAVPPPQPAPSPPSVAAADPPTARSTSPRPVTTTKPSVKEPAAVTPPAQKPVATVPEPVPVPPPAPSKSVRPPPPAAKPKPDSRPSPPPKPIRPPSVATKTASAAPGSPTKPAAAAPVTQSSAPAPERSEPVGKITESRPSSRLDSSVLLGQIASLETETQRRASAGVRSKRVSPNDTQSLEGFYIAAWVRKVEQIGEMNFPEIARRLNLNTGPVLDVAIRADGSLREVRVVRSSGYAELDQAAQRIVKLGAPYAPFPPSLRQKYDVLQIARPWRFDPGGQVRAR